jgi:cation diffusion facilitator CzcD-associated flavoprotein CzcO
VALQGQEMFRGVQMHAKELQDVTVAERKRVVVIGAGKTALDCAAEVAVSGRAAGVTWLFRQVGEEEFGGLW